LSVLKI